MNVFFLFRISTIEGNHPEKTNYLTNKHTNQ